MKLTGILTEDQILFLEEMNANIVLLLEGELQLSDEEPDFTKDEDDVKVNQQEQEPEPEDAQEQEDTQPEPTIEDQFAYELEGAEDKFIQLILYNRLMELSTKLELLEINVQDGVGVKSTYFYNKLSQYKQYVDVLNELIFSISTATIYKLVGQIELELIELLNEYTIAYNDNLIYDEAREAK